ncbi:MAG: hypothetical protein K1562_15795, partial [Candidatus Thiodiazotropha sp. (ex. Lucinisca nassula)]|nr:hypothetical protein [Candidatus Thiodiazotropha sp. (ex. Lucinisca nassula)]
VCQKTLVLNCSHTGGAYATAVFGGINILKEEFDLVPDAISGICSSSPLAMREIESFTDLPIIQSMEKDFKKIFGFIG